MILGKNWLDKRKTTFNKIYNTLQICDWGVYYQLSIRRVDAGSIISDQSDQSEHDEAIRKVDKFYSLFDTIENDFKRSKTYLAGFSSFLLSPTECNSE